MAKIIINYKNSHPAESFSQKTGKLKKLDMLRLELLVVYLYLRKLTVQKKSFTLYVRSLKIILSNKTQELLNLKFY